MLECWMLDADSVDCRPCWMLIWMLCGVSYSNSRLESILEEIDEVLPKSIFDLDYLDVHVDFHWNRIRHPEGLDEALPELSHASHNHTLEFDFILWKG